MALVRTVLPRKSIVQPQHGASYETDVDNNWSIIDSLLQDSTDVSNAIAAANFGFTPTAGSLLTLNIASGKGFLNGVLTSYAGGTLALTAASTCYVYLDPASSLQPAFNTTGFLPGQLPVAVVVTGATAITSVTDKRTHFNQTFGLVAAGKVLAGPATGPDAYPAARALVASDLPGAPASANQFLGGPVTGAAADPAFRVLNVADLPASAIRKVAASDLTAQAADIGATVLYAVPAGAGGLYRLAAYLAVTQAATTSSTLPKVTIAWTDADNSTAQSLDITATNAGNLLTTLAQALAVVNAKAATSISFSTSGYASVGATAMQFAIHLRLEAL